MPAATGRLGEGDVRQQHAQRGSAAFAPPRSGLYPGAQAGEPLVDMVPGLHVYGAAYERARGLPDSLDVVAGAAVAGARCDGPHVAPAFMVGPHEQVQEFVHGAVGAGDVAGDRRGDAVAVVGRSLPVVA
ncbi:hypothetical protein AB0M29_41340 [Streptomyces sp. NPDC051976]|uniref:hypothetical protein n=1 Tax=Streptomyces sp. NPDC051976 TaxID=3154947 RepID=UPI00341D2322